MNRVGTRALLGYYYRERHIWAFFFLGFSLSSPLSSTPPLHMLVTHILSISARTCTERGEFTEGEMQHLIWLLIYGISDHCYGRDIL